MLHNIVVRFDEIKLKFNQSVKLLSSKGPKATHESHQYTIVMVHRVHYRKCIHYVSEKQFTIYVQFTVQ